MADWQKIASRSIDEEGQERFAQLSGDRNPIHMDALAARRTAAGLPVVHGVHTLLWAMESMAAEGTLPAAPTRVKAKFLRWVYLGDVAELFVADGGTKLEVRVLGMPVLSGDVLFAAAANASTDAELKDSAAGPKTEPVELAFGEMQGLSGDAYVAPDGEALADFPALSGLIGPRAVAELAACSYVVGMEVPGLYSMFSRLDVGISPASASQPHALHFAVEYADERFHKARVAVRGASVEGALDVFMRDAPVQQASVSSLGERVTAGEFARMHALIVGGSRGLGELTAKLIAAGGGASTITYARGRTDAELVAKEIAAAGAEIATAQYDVLKAPAPQLDALSGPVTHLFYFATNAIFRPKGELVSPPILAEFMAYYVKGFYDLCLELLRREAGRKLKVYYPSSIAVEDRPAGMTEYSMAKAAAEVMCADMSRFLPGLEIVSTRLPRLRTDQTTSVVPDRDQDPVEVLLPILRGMMS